MRTNQVLSQQKGRLAGFFLLLLSACQPSQTVVPGSLEFSKAQQAIQAKLSIKAAEHLALAIQQGHPDASSQWIRLTQTEQGPLQQYQQLQQWRSQPLDADSAALLGLWQEQGLTRPQLSPEPATSQCQLNIQPALLDEPRARIARAGGIGVHIFLQPAIELAGGGQLDEFARHDEDEFAARIEVAHGLLDLRRADRARQPHLGRGFGDCRLGRITLGL